MKNIFQKGIYKSKEVCYNGAGKCGGSLNKEGAIWKKLP